MSDIMDHGVIGMPFEMAMSSHLSRLQFYQRAQDILRERDELRAEVERERESRKAAQARQEELTAEVVRLEPMRQRAADIERLTAEVERLKQDHAAVLGLVADIRTQRTVIDDQQTELDRKSDAIQRLWAERDALRTEVERLEQLNHNQRLDICGLHEEVERLREDAARLDWLSDIALSMDAVSDPDSLTQVHFGTDPCRTAYGRTLRAAIDSARGAKG